MSPRGPAAWPPWALLLLWLPGCAPLSGPSNVTGTEGGSLSVQCQYGKEFKDNNKLWCKYSLPLICHDIVRTKDSEREVRIGQVSISDHPANLSFTVTMERLTLQDAGSYECQVDKAWQFNPSFRVEVTVLPATSGTPTSVTIAKTSTTTTNTPAAPSTSLATQSATTGSSSQDLYHDQRSGLPVLLSLLALLLLLLVGSSLLVWRRLQKRVKAGEHSELSQNLRQAAGQSEPYYANLTLQTWSLQEKPVSSKHAEVEYSTVACAREDLHYTEVAFDSQKQESSANSAVPQRSPEEVPQYSVISKPRAKDA